MKTLDNLKAFSLKKKQMKQVGGGSYCTDLITNYNNNHTKWSKEVQVWGIERSGFFNGREKWAKGFENQRV